MAKLLATVRPLMLPPSPPMLMALAAVAGVLVTFGLLLLQLAKFIRDGQKAQFDAVNKRLDELKADQNRQFVELKADMRQIKADQNSQFAELKADMRQVLNAVLGVKQ